MAGYTVKLLMLKPENPWSLHPPWCFGYNRDNIMGGALANDKGEFNIENLPAMGGFRLRITQIGYKNMRPNFYIQMPNKLEQGPWRHCA